MKGVVLAAGAGTRMWPLATAKPKHLLPIAGHSLLSFTLKALASAGIKELVLVVGFGAQQIRSALGDGGQYGVNIEYVSQPEWTGTASAIGVAHDAVGNEPFVALYGDLLMAPTCIDSVLEKARESSKVMGIVRVSNLSQYGVVETKGDQVTRISEKPQVGRVARVGSIAESMSSMETFFVLSNVPRVPSGESMSSPLHCRG